MTALTVPGRPEEDASLRPVPWRRMAWVTWRQHRIALAGVAVFLGALAVCVWPAGLKTHHAYAATVAACRPVAAAACGGMSTSFIGTNGFLANGLILQRGVAFAAWTLAAFAIGALAGLLTRRVVPAIAATLGVYAGLVLATGGLLRQHYLTPLVASNPNVPASAWIMSQWWSKGGRYAFTGSPPDSLISRFCSARPTGPFGKAPEPSFVQCLSQHGYTLWTSYQPASRFWAFQ
jgi:hypothetical protein